ncbi:glycosyl hydrolases family 18-domain-containing protein [Halteromyces radiatus]|uniref:glycosyl hydrolases family 18-domain-containing protein n=1 Tax=Halteromyces radiatus TaxID=101107 RepID=UPI00221F59BE|nr:glycosyl hydrolases family 18-domain-containing protein [Halteromyces radiatus]KAI8100104.1 glycosyl hydrolases family 18-domain-containing protein [Halteromyces radiatus]
MVVREGFEKARTSKLLLLGTLLYGVISLCEAASREKKKVIGYFPNWLYNSYPSSNIPFEKYSHINYAFALQNHDDGVPFFQDDWAIDNYLPELIRSAHTANTKVLLSIGGWTGSEKFSPMVASPVLRKRFIDWNLDFIEQYNTDGVDIDWEYPGKQAAGCNVINEKDTDNLLLLLKELRTALDKRFPDDYKEISMAVYVLPFMRNGAPATDVSDFVPYFDHINLMTYDINGAWAPVTGPNAPFESESNKGADFSFVKSIQAWKSAGVPSEKINAGLAFYGRSMQATKDMTTTGSQYQEALVGAPKGDSDDAYWANPFCSADIDGVSGIWKWSNLRSEGLIKKDTTQVGQGWVRHWDDHSKTPWLFNPTSKLFISYDDPASLKIKVNHAACEDLGGVMVWDVHQDNGELIDVVSSVNDVPSSCYHQLSVGDDGVPPTSTSRTGNKASPATNVSVLATASTSRPSSFIATPPAVMSSPSSSHLAKDSKVASSGPSSKSIAQHSSTPKPSIQAQHGSSCSTPGIAQCIQQGSKEWLTCDITRKWVSRVCGEGLVCYNASPGLYCGHPEANKLDSRLDNKFLRKPVLAVEPISGKDR